MSLPCTGRGCDDEPGRRGHASGGTAGSRWSSSPVDDAAPSAVRSLSILHLNTVGNAGGAGRAAVRLHHGLVRLGHDSRILAGHPVGLAPGIRHLDGVAPASHTRVDSALSRIGGVLDQALGVGRWSYPASWRLFETDLFQQADVVHLHNLHGGYFNVGALEHLAHYKPLVWTLHDMWALTGHCAYAYDCERWRDGCHSCPLLRGRGRQLVEPAPTLLDRTRLHWDRKRRIYRTTPLHVVAPSLWLEGLVRTSILSPAQSIRHIPYGLDLNRYRPVDKLQARRSLHLPTGVSIVFFSADDVQNRRKGYAYLLQALRQVRAPEEVCLLVSGKRPPAADQLDPIRVHVLGHLEDEEQQRLAISAADVCVSPTLADNLPMVLLESLACGVPSVAFDVGGVGEIVRHMETGYLARCRDVDDLVRGLDVLLHDVALRRRISHRARQVAEAEYSSELSARRYVSLYEHAVESHQEHARRAPGPGRPWSRSRSSRRR